MKKRFLFILIPLLIVHFLILHMYGISWFGTTLLFYYAIYKILNWLINFINSTEKRKTFLRNLQILMVLLLLIEFCQTFIFGTMNNFMENEKGIYFSEYMRHKQVKLLHDLGWKDVQIAWTNGYKPNTNRTHKAEEFEYSFTTNSYGLRGKLPFITKDSNEYRIIVLGDSFIEGFGTPNDSTFPVLLQQELQHTNKKTTVINAGICGSNPLYEIEFYSRKLQQFKPDLIILQTNITDLYDIEYAIHQGKMPVREYFSAVSHIFRGFYIGVLNNNLINEYASKSTVKKRNANIDLLIQELKKFKEHIEKDHTNLVIVYLPSKGETYNITEDIKPTKKLKKELLISGISIIDLENEYKKINFINTKNFKKYYWQKDGHHTPKGYYLMSEIVAEELIKKKFR